MQREREQITGHMGAGMCLPHRRPVLFAGCVCRDTGPRAKWENLSGHLDTGARLHYIMTDESVIMWARR